MSTSKVNIDKLSLEIIKQLELYQDTTQEIVERAVKNTAKLTAMEVNENAAEAFGGNEYNKSWSYKRDKSLKGKWAFSMVVYSKPPNYRLAHLLERGHAKVNGGRVEGKEHIRPAEESAIKNLENYIIEGIKANK